MAWLYVADFIVVTEGALEGEAYKMWTDSRVYDLAVLGPGAKQVRV
jgi:hypothetical protein